MYWLTPNEFARRPLVAVEDHVYHISELLRAIQRTSHDLLESLTVVCLDRVGPDTDAAVQDWLNGYPEIQVAARLADSKVGSNWQNRLLAFGRKRL